MGHPVVHFEFMSRDPAKTSAFYEKIFGWKVQHMPELNYRLIDTAGEGGINGGIAQPNEGPLPGLTCLYMQVDDLADCRRRIAEAGGKILVDEQTVPGMGSLALFTDPDGRLMGLWKPAAQA